MKKLFDDLSFDVSKETTRKYSTSFSLGIMALNTRIRPAIYSIYGFVRLADEIVDSFHDYDKHKLLERLKLETKQSIDEKISLNPILNSFQKTVNDYQIEWDLIERFLMSMAMDLDKVDYNPELYEKYIYGSAEVVGLMCLKVFVEGNHSQYETLKPYAMILGSAFQKVNFLRDLKDDYHVLGRTYFPQVNMNEFNCKVKKEIENEIENEFKQALIGIKMLPESARFGVYLAYSYYVSLFRKIQRTPAKNVINKRIRIHNGKKFSLFMSSYFQFKMTFI